jgi:hypothetical protein
MHEELENIERNHKSIGTKWVWKNKEGEKGEVVRNKSRLVAQGSVRRRGSTTRRPLLPWPVWRR